MQVPPDDPQDLFRQLEQLQVQADGPLDPQDSFQLLQLPDPALDRVLQQLDQCSLACTAVTCSTLRHTVPAYSKLKAHCSSAESRDGFDSWRAQHRSSLTGLTQLSIVGSANVRFDISLGTLSFLVGPVLRQLRLQHCDLLPAGVDVLQKCTQLAALVLEHCRVQSSAAAAAAIAALPELRSLRLAHLVDKWRRPLLAVDAASLAALPQLTHVGFAFGTGAMQPVDVAELSQLSALTNLQHLQLTALPRGGVPGGLPSQLVKLTCLDVSYYDPYGTQADQLQHLSSLTALQQLSVQQPSEPMGGLSGLSGIQHLSQLTGLKLASSHVRFSTTSTASWACLTALQSLELMGCVVQPEALEALTQLQLLSLDANVVWGPRLRPFTPCQGLLAAVAKLTLLTELHFIPSHGSVEDAAADMTALTASTNLCTLRLQLDLPSPMQEPGAFDNVLFRKGMEYPRLRLISLHREVVRDCMSVSNEVLQQLCSCCPAVERLDLTWSWGLHKQSSAQGLQPLLQLSALTHLEVYRVGAAAKTVLRVAAQLTKLKRLKLQGLTQTWQSAQRMLLQLTVLTALEQFEVTNAGGNSWNRQLVPEESRTGSWFQRERLVDRVELQNKARWFHPPDVWLQLKDLLSDAVVQPGTLLSAAGSSCIAKSKKEKKNKNKKK